MIPVHVRTEEPGNALNLSLRFLPEALSGHGTHAADVALGEEEGRRLNQIRACAYLHVFDTFEGELSRVARERASSDVESREVLAPLLRFDVFDHHELFASFETSFAGAFPVAPQLVEPAPAFARALELASAFAVLVLALHLKLVTQQHYLACVRGGELLEPRFVRLLREHWEVECGQDRTVGSTLAIQQRLAAALPGRVPAALRDYRLLVFACDDVLRRQAELDVGTLEAARGETFEEEARASVLAVEISALQKTFLTVGIVNAAFVYAMRSLGPTAPAMLAGVVSALSAR